MFTSAALQSLHVHSQSSPMPKLTPQFLAQQLLSILFLKLPPVLHRPGNGDSETDAKHLAGVVYDGASEREVLHLHLCLEKLGSEAAVQELKARFLEGEDYQLSIDFHLYLTLSQRYDSEKLDLGEIRLPVLMVKCLHFFNGFPQGIFQLKCNNCSHVQSP